LKSEKWGTGAAEGAEKKESSQLSAFSGQLRHGGRKCCGELKSANCRARNEKWGTGAGIENNKTLDASKVALFKRHIFLTFCPLFL